MAKKPVMLMILDGFGIAPNGDGNAVETAKKPNYDNLLALLLNGNEFDDKFNRHLATTLLIGLSNKRKKEKNLEFELS